MWPHRLLNPGPLTYESGALPTALHGPAYNTLTHYLYCRSLFNKVPIYDIKNRENLILFFDM